MITMSRTTTRGIDLSQEQANTRTDLMIAMVMQITKDKLRTIQGSTSSMSNTSSSKRRLMPTSKTNSMILIEVMMTCGEMKLAPFESRSGYSCTRGTGIVEKSPNRTSVQSLCRLTFSAYDAWYSVSLAETSYEVCSRLETLQQQ